MKNTSKIIFAVIALTIVFNFAGLTFVQAQDASAPYRVLAPLPCIEAYGVECNGENMQLQKTVTFETYLQYFLNVIIGLSAVFAVLMIVYGGFLYMTTGTFQGKTDAKDKITHAIYGLLLVFSSFLILKTIDPRFVDIPTTLVPKLKINVELTEFMKNIENDIIKYGEESNKIAADLLAAQAGEREIRIQIEELNKKIVEAKDAKNTEEVAKLEKARDELITKQNSYNTSEALARAKLEFNSKLRNISSAFTAVNPTPNNSNFVTTDVVNQRLNGYTDIEMLKQIDENISELKSIHQKYLNQLKSFGSYDMQEINDYANYTEALLKLYKANVYIKIDPESDFAYEMLHSLIAALPNIKNPSLNSVISSNIAALQNKVKLTDTQYKQQKDSTPNGLTPTY